MPKVKVVEKLKKEARPSEETKTVRVKVPLSLYKNLEVNAKKVSKKPDALLLLAAEETDIFDKPTI
jgi:rRNA-processing protein FCF1